MATQQEKKHQPVGHVEAPDGGWGWVVVVALFIASALVFGLIRSLGVFFVEFVQHFGESAQAVSWITSIGVATQQLLSEYESERTSFFMLNIDSSFFHTSFYTGNENC